MSWNRKKDQKAVISMPQNQVMLVNHLMPLEIQAASVQL